MEDSSQLMSCFEKILGSIIITYLTNKFMFEPAGQDTEKEKIEYLVNGLETIIQAEDISFDTGYLYINKLNRLNLLNIAVVKPYYNPHA